MFGSDWSKQFKAWGGLAGALFAAAVLLIVGAWPAVLEDRELGYEAAHKAAYYSKYAKDKIAIECAGLSGQARSNCAYEINEAARENQREEYDLYSQRSMALWTGVMGGMAVVGVSLSLVGVYLIWQTWMETRATVNVTKEVGQAQVRAYLNVSEIEYDVLDGGDVELFVRAENIGQSPARDVEAVFDLFVKPAKGDTVAFGGELSLPDLMAKNARSEKMTYLQTGIPPDIRQTMAWAEIRIAVFATDVFDKEVVVFARMNRFIKPDKSGGFIDMADVMSSAARAAMVRELRYRWRKGKRLAQRQSDHT